MDEENTISILEKLQSFKPQSDTEIWERAVFLAVALGSLACDTLTGYVRFCLKDSDRESQFSLDDEIYQEVSKNLILVNIWLLYLESSQDNVQKPGWFLDFIFSAFTVADILVARPPVKEFFQLYPPELETEVLLQSLSMVICHRLKLGASRPEAALALGELIADSKRQRQELLSFALQQNLLTLDAWVAQMRPGSLPGQS